MRKGKPPSRSGAVRIRSLWDKAIGRRTPRWQAVSRRHHEAGYDKADYDGQHEEEAAD
jgi:hypothetical protein